MEQSGTKKGIKMNAIDICNAYENPVWIDKFGEDYADRIMWALRKDYEPASVIARRAKVHTACARTTLDALCEDLMARHNGASYGIRRYAAWLA